MLKMKELYKSQIRIKKYKIKKKLRDINLYTTCLIIIVKICTY